MASILAIKSQIWTNIETNWNLLSWIFFCWKCLWPKIVVLTFYLILKSYLWQASLSLIHNFKAPKHLCIKLDEYNLGKANLTKTPFVYSNKADDFKTAWSDFNFGLGLITGDGSVELAKWSWPEPDKKPLLLQKLENLKILEYLRLVKVIPKKSRWKISGPLLKEVYLRSLLCSDRCYLKLKVQKSNAISYRDL